MKKRAHAGTYVAAAALLIAFATCAAAQNGAASTRSAVLPSRITQVLQDENSLTLISVLDENLDLAARLQREGAAIPALVPLAPPLVVGEGADPSNQTLVRVLNKYGIAESSFLAFSPSVRGGVSVASGRNARGQSVIAAAPISAKYVRKFICSTSWAGRLEASRRTRERRYPSILRRLMLSRVAIFYRSCAAMNWR